MLWMQERRPQDSSLPKFLNWTTLLRQNRSDRSSSGLALQEKIKTSFKGPIASRTRQGLQEASQRQEKKYMSKIRVRICYTCRVKGYLSQDCPNGKQHKSKVVNSASNVHGNSNGLYNTRKVISSPSYRAIWVPKFLLTNLKRTQWDLGTKTCVKGCRWLEVHRGLDFHAMLQSTSKVSSMKGYMNILIQCHLKARWVLNHDLVLNVYLKSCISCKKSCDILCDI
jgi:hypothetical protein